MNSPNAVVKNEFEIHGRKIKISVLKAGEGGGDWREHLALISSSPSRLVGLVYPPLGEGDTYFCYAALQYVCHMKLAPIKKKVLEPESGQEIEIPVGFNGSTDIHALIPYDLFMTPTVEIPRPEHIIWMRDQQPHIREWFEQEYLRVFDPPRVLR